MKRPLLLLAALLAGSVSTALAQDAQRHGFWFEVGFGYGSAAFACDSCDYRHATASDHMGINGGTVSLGLGGTPSPRFRVGAEYRAWLHDQHNDSTPTIETLSLLFTMYARERGGPFVEAGVGLSEYSLQKARADLIEPESKAGAFVSGGGLALNFGAGWDFRGFSPRIAYSLARESPLKGAGGATVATGWRHHVLLLELSMRGQP